MENTKTFPQKKLPSKAQRHKLFGSVMPVPRSKPVDKVHMADLQNTKKDFLFDLDAVGITKVKHPITIYSSIAPTVQTSIGEFTFSSSLSHSNKGTNMSRFNEQLAKYHRQGFSTDLTTLKTFTKELAERLDQQDASLRVDYTWFYERNAPDTQLAGLNHADVSISVNYDKQQGYDIRLSLSVSITTLCPCSKEISEYSAHNQRGNVTMDVKIIEDFDETTSDWKEILLEAAESNASARLHPILKRTDEKMVTEQAYENPRFVEDMVRLVAADLYEVSEIRQFKVTCQNEESIHMHDAVASVTYDKDNE
ncbi:GTP cyclohydrolase FolE2 [Virgibacillus salexigens]|uniref:GTP cyclohydrolase FolE2 n=1 Tax=Virgibacillus massiliensis TaxID=1462526 RepID=A0A024QCH1_9BACI|nr:MULTISPECIES: GTP cyclohydrolase FolE2 [Virgibacillus]MYL42072.1 GTP cyclohydrolase I FolE2 [Virgibacillus massiliensis]CDQ39900.1 GTP cyclohydrolase folE2 [Virgibacillus massiliensis]